MTLMKLRILKVKQRLCASIAKPFYQLVGEEAAQVILRGIMKFVCQGVANGKR